MSADLVAGLVDMFQRRARQFELPTRFQANTGPRLFEPNKVAPLLNG